MGFWREPFRRNSEGVIVQGAEKDQNWQVVTQSPVETEQLGMLLGEKCVPGTVVGLIGNLGAGKTHFVQGIAQGLGASRFGVTSPTFTLIQEYDGRIPIAHFDTYRLRSSQEFLELGTDEYLQGDWVSLVEWADRVDEWLPADRLTVRIEHVGENERRLSFLAGGARSSALLQSMKGDWSSTT